ncbi:MAG: bifunctional hydroxymethylpyrimidine kinase/phosphomethylpyrimidine kinase [Bacillota bacterium]|nr:bifunctional hydroxymethylpyrimidine kinase/phosphomethylpyrimidine kinase [Bacillota bacterium]
MKKALSIAGSDCSGGAGIQADLKTFSAHGVYGMSVITSVVAENTCKVYEIENISPDIVGSQIDAIFEDIETDAVKIGMLPTADCMAVVAKKLRFYRPKNIVIDPVMYSKDGSALMDPQSVDIFINEILPLADVLTPNIPEAERISGIIIDNIESMKKAAKIICQKGCKAVLVKGGHASGDATDVLFDGEQFYCFSTARINTKNTHGTGCTYSSAIASNLALGMAVQASVEKAKTYMTTAIKHSLVIGKGFGPTNHFYDLYKKGEIDYDL